jgi:predicted anti-sigma-YlaC factor YlaD
MTCKECIQHLDRFDGSTRQMLPNQVVEHLSSCQSCAAAYRAMQVVDAYVDSQQKMQPSAFLAARVMAQIGKQPSRKPIHGSKVRPLMLAASVAATIVLGIVVGKLFNAQTHTTSNDMAIIDDSHLESISLLTSE